MRIAEVSERSGFSPATLRYYEQLDLLPAPHRTASGYRSYDEAVLDRLAFIGRAKRLGCSLEDVAGLMPAWDGRHCAPVQDGLRALAAAKLEESLAGGIRLHLDVATPVDRLAQLMAAEHGCCRFFAFALTVDARGAALEVRGPAEGLALFD